MTEHRLTTRAIHAGDPENPLPSVAPPIVQSATFELESAAQGAAFSAAIEPAQFYTRWGNPNHKQAEEILANLERAEAALVAASGMGAISATVMAHVRAGDHIVAGDSLYAGTTELFTEVLPHFGVETTAVDQTDLEAIRSAMRGTTRIVYVESITNPVLKLVDLPAVAALAREAGAISMIDNTFATPANARPIEHGFDCVLHSLTKYLNGHSDVVAGAVAAKRATIERVWFHMKILGCPSNPFDAWLTVRGLKTFGPRMERHNAGALAVARFLERHPKVARVYYPGLESHPQHALARRQLDGFGGMVTFELDGDVEGGRRLVEAVEVIKLAVSLGSVESLIIHPASATHAVIPREARLRAGITDGLIRLSVGIEDPQDLIADLEQALAKA